MKTQRPWLIIVLVIVAVIVLAIVALAAIWALGEPASGLVVIP